MRAVKVDNVAITGKGVIDGQGREASYNLLDQIQKAAAQKLCWQRPRYDAVKRPVHTGDIDLDQNFLAVHVPSSHCVQSVFSVSF